MATTLATIFDRFFAARALEQAASRVREQEEDLFRLRRFANDDVYFYIKSIDNSRVVRETDPAARGVCWKMIGSSIAVAVLTMGLLLPMLQGLIAGYRLETLRHERQRLELERASLELEETKLVSPARLDELARLQRFVDPAPQKVVRLEQRDSTLRASREQEAKPRE